MPKTTSRSDEHATVAANSDDAGRRHVTDEQAAKMEIVRAQMAFKQAHRDAVNRSYLNLVDSLREHFGPKNYRELAKAARVGVATAKEFLDDRAAPPTPKPGKRKVTSRQRQFFIRSLYRLWNALPAEIQPDWKSVVEAYGEDPNDEWVQGEWQSLEKSERPDAIPRGPVIDRIFDRAKGGDLEGEVMIGIFLWEPYAELSGYMKSMIVAYLQRLVGSISPMWKPRFVKTYDSLAEAISAISRPADELDMLGILYDTTFRRLQGVKFVRLPGLGARLGALHSNAGNPGWQSLFEDAHSAVKRSSFVVVMEGEIGHIYASGPRGYIAHTDDLLVVKSFDAQQVADAIRKAMQEQGERTVVFVADVLSCREVLEKLGHNSGVKLLDRENQGDLHGPVYPVGIALPGNDEEWRRIVEEAQRQELFEHDHVHTAEDYAQLLIASGGDIGATPLTPMLSAVVANRFALEVLKRLCSSIMAMEEQGKAANLIHNLKSMSRNVYRTWTDPLPEYLPLTELLEAYDWLK